MDAIISARTIRSADNTASSSSDKHSDSLQAMVDNRYRFEQLVMVDSPDRFLYYMCVIGKCALKGRKYQKPIAYFPPKLRLQC